MWKQCEASAGRRTVCGRRCRCKITQKTAPVNATLLSFLPACAQAASPAASPLAAPVLHQILRKDCDLPLPPSSDRAPFDRPSSPCSACWSRQRARLCSFPVGHLLLPSQPSATAPVASSTKDTQEETCRYSKSPQTTVWRLLAIWCCDGAIYNRQPGTVAEA